MLEYVMQSIDTIVHFRKVAKAATPQIKATWKAKHCKFNSQKYLTVSGC